VVSLIGLAQPGKIMRGVTANMCERHLHQLHVCMPSRRGHTRLLYRMSLDFMGWVRYVPGILNVWKSVAGQVLGEDLVLVAGQQDRLERGGDTWANPVSYDKLAVRYRRWRNSVATSGESSQDGEDADALLGAPISMSAGELFRLEDDAEVYVDRQ
jgi:chlorophyllide a oxygenase